MTFSMLNVGQGDALFIEMPSGVQVLVDAGPDSSLMKRLEEKLPFYDKHIDLIIVTNPDKDHYGGFIYLIEKYKVGKMIVPEVAKDSATYKSLLEKVKGKNVKIESVRAGEDIILDKDRNIKLETLFPDRLTTKYPPNEGSIILKLIYGNTSFLLTGDTTKVVEDYLVKYASSSLKSNILKVGHHGSKTSSGEEFVRSVAPDIALISMGQGNSYGHPHKETIETLKKYTKNILMTKDLGTIDLESDGKVIKVFR